MEDQAQATGSQWSHGGLETERRTEPVRSRWAPKPEQILILESIFNSGMVNPPRNETVRIRKVLEKFGPVGDANVFYWFQNRRSRSRRRQRLIQTSFDGGGGGEQPPKSPAPASGAPGNIIHYENTLGGGFGPNSVPYGIMNRGPSSSSSCVVGSSSSSSSSSVDGNDNSDDFLSLLGRRPTALQVQEYEQSPIFGSADASGLNYQPQVMTVFINGVVTEVEKGAVDMKALFGGGFVMYHCSGLPVEVNEYGFMVQGLQHGESYFLVPKHS